MILLNVLHIGIRRRCCDGFNNNQNIHSYQFSVIYKYIINADYQIFISDEIFTRRYEKPVYSKFFPYLKVADFP